MSSQTMFWGSRAAQGLVGGQALLGWVAAADGQQRQEASGGRLTLAVAVKQINLVTRRKSRLQQMMRVRVAMAAGLSPASCRRRSSSSAGSSCHHELSLASLLAASMQLKAHQTL